MEDAPSEAMRIISSDSSWVPPATTVPSASIFSREARLTARAWTVRESGESFRISPMV